MAQSNSVWWLSLIVVLTLNHNIKLPKADVLPDSEASFLNLLPEVLTVNLQNLLHWKQASSESHPFQKLSYKCI